jgi:hypothetical protein
MNLQALKKLLLYNSMNSNQELILSQNYPKIGKLGTLKPITTTKIQILNIPSEIELLLLSANLNYQAKLIMDGEAKRTGELTVIECIDQSMRIMAIVEDYKNRYITYAELKKIKKEYKLNRLYA